MITNDQKVKLIKYICHLQTFYKVTNKGIHPFHFSLNFRGEGTEFVAHRIWLLIVKEHTVCRVSWVQEPGDYVVQSCSEINLRVILCRVVGHSVVDEDVRAWPHHAAAVP